MHWLVTASRGQLGSALCARLARDPRHSVRGLAHAELDITDAAALARRLDESPGSDVLVNAAAYTDVDGCEDDPERARRVNAEAPAVLARLARERGIRLVHVSTDFVFDGEAGEPYTESAPTAPLQEYGRSKRAGEQAVLAEAPEALLIRAAWIYGRGRNFVAAVLGRAASGGALRVVTDQVGSPTWAGDLAQGLMALVEADARGLYHLANAGAASRWELARAALDLAGHEGVPIEGIGSEAWPAPARRPSYTVLDCTRAARAGVVLRGWREALAAYLASEEAPLRRAAALDGG